MRRLLLTAMICACLAPAQPVVFEAASVRLSPPPTPGWKMFIRGGPGSSDPGLLTAENEDLSGLVAMAYGIQRHQLAAPDWLNSTRVHVSARVPQGTTADQYRLMLQNLLAERFGLVVHRDRKEIQIYELVLAKGGSKLKEVEAEPPSSDGLQPPPQRASPPPGTRIPVNLRIARISMERFASYLSGLLGEPIIDNTGLKGAYEVKLWAVTGSTSTVVEAESPAPGIFDAVQEQLGLRLAPKKVAVDLLVIDRMEKVPSEN